jgi:hypothetical protein
MAITDWMPTLKTKVAEIRGLVQIHTMDELPGTLQVFPSAIITVIAGAFEYSVGGPCIDLHEVQITIFLANQVLPEANALALPFIAGIRDKLAANIKLAALVDHILPADGRTYDGPGAVRYGDKEHTGIIFRYMVKENVTGDFTVSA